MPRGKIGLAAAGMLGAVALAACSSGTSLLATGATKTAATGVQPATPKERAAHAATTSAQAAKCGYNFDPVRLRASYLVWEGQQGTAPGDLGQLEQVYDTTRGRIAAAIANPDGFCSDEQTEKIKRDLAKQLGGDFTAPPKRPEVPWWHSSRKDQGFDRDKVFNPSSIK